MYQGIRPLVTTGVALVGASVIAVSPISVPPPDVQAPPLPAAQRAVEMSDVQLASLASDLERFFDAVRVAPDSSAHGIETIWNSVESGLENATSTRQVVNAIAFGLAFLPSAAIGPYLMPLVANVPGQNVPGLGTTPGDLTDWDFGDAAAQILLSLIGEPIGLVTFGPTVIYLATTGAYTPRDLAAVVVDTFASKPFNYALPWVAALANTLPSPLGGGVNPTSFDDSGAITRAFLSARNGVGELISNIFYPDQQMIQQKQGVAKIQAEDTWPPSFEEAGDALESFGTQLRNVPEFLGNAVVRTAQVAAQYLEAGRPLDAIRLIAASALVVPVELAGPPVLLGANLLPPPIGGLPTASDHDGGLLVSGFSQTQKIVSNIVRDIAPNPLPASIEHKQITLSGINAPQGNSGNIVNLSLPDPKKKLEDNGNLIVSQGVDNKDGTTVTKTDNNRPKVGSNVRAVVREVRNDIRQTVKDVRQGVRDVVKAVTGLGKKKDEAAKSEAPQSE